MNEGRFSALFIAHAASLVRLAHLLGARDAEDVVQHAFCKVYAGRHNLRDDDVDAGRYLRRVVVNEVRDRHRRAVVAARYLHLTRAATGDPNDADLMQRTEVAQAVRRLPTRQREAVVLRFWLDLPVAEVADVMGVSLGTAKSHLSRGVAVLRESLETPSGHTVEGP